MPLRLIHTADWQLGKNYDRVSDADKRARLRQERIAVVARIGREALDHGAQLILVAGDLFDSPTASRETVVNALSAIGQLPVPVIAIPGNHDHGGPAGIWEQDFFRRQQQELAPNFRVLLERQPYDAGVGWILPCPLLRRAESSDPTTWLRDPAVFQACGDGRPVIVLAHGSTQDFGSAYDDEEGDSAGRNLIGLGLLPQSAIDYVALGDWHGTKEITPRAWYSGTPEPDRFTKGGDHDPGNVLLVEVGRGKTPEVRKISTAGLGWHTLNFEFSGDGSLQELELQLQDLIGTRAGEDLLQLDLGGTLGLEAATRLEQKIEALQARLLRLKLRDRSSIAPTPEEIGILAAQNADPLIAGVASVLFEESRGTGETAETAKVALRELFAACSTLH